MTPFDTSTFLVLGLGLTGMSCVEFLHANVASKQLRVMDDRPAEALSEPALLKLNELGLDHHVSSWNEQWLDWADYIVISPGIDPNQSVFAPYQAKLINDLTLFSWVAKAPIYAVTGSNGKSTVVHLLETLFKASGKNVAMGGNFGLPMLSLLDNAVDAYVLELSSFQLEVAGEVAYQAASFLNLSEDHMDRHGDMATYGQIKSSIYQNAAVCISNADDQATWPTPKASEACVHWQFSTKNAADACLIDGCLSVHGQALLSADELKLVGEHNLSNVLAALLLISAQEPKRLNQQDKGDKVFDEALLKTLRDYSGLEYRCQLIAEKNNIRWVNDSKGTNVGATVAACEGLSDQKNLILLVGGVGKDADFSELGRLNTIKSAIGFGRDGRDIIALMSQTQTQYVETLEEAVACANDLAEAGDTVLFSPACASFDQFTNYQARGQAFNALVSEVLQ
ncbi:MAG: UDP-N-acetylmuramoyl-L-alanine--D-glutamate ligase [Pseudomonadota bacterium]|nr:UDP-N-acetylmuramoyl-L-alanine--D-glutamate ligase [Pseudomonadota bacterium]